MQTNAAQPPGNLKTHFNLFPPAPFPFDVATNIPLSKSANGASLPSQEMHIVEVKNTNVDAPKEIAEFFKQGGEETAIDANKLMSRNWLWAQIAGGGSYLSDNRKWIADLWKEKFYLQKVVHKNVGARWYIVFKGTPGLREEITADRKSVV